MALIIRPLVGYTIENAKDDLGNSGANLSGYVKTEELNVKLNDYVENSTLNTKLNTYSTITYVENELSNYASKQLLTEGLSLKPSFEVITAIQNQVDEQEGRVSGLENNFVSKTSLGASITTNSVATNSLSTSGNVSIGGSLNIASSSPINRIINSSENVSPTDNQLMTYKKFNDVLTNNINPISTKLNTVENQLINHNHYITNTKYITISDIQIEYPTEQPRIRIKLPAPIEDSLYIHDMRFYLTGATLPSTQWTISVEKRQIPIIGGYEYNWAAPKIELDVFSSVEFIVENDSTVLLNFIQQRPELRIKITDCTIGYVVGGKYQISETIPDTIRQVQNEISNHTHTNFEDLECKNININNSDLVFHFTEENIDLAPQIIFREGPYQFARIVPNYVYGPTHFEIATYGRIPIVVRQYLDDDITIYRSLTLLDDRGDTQIEGNTKIDGNLEVRFNVQVGSLIEGKNLLFNNETRLKAAEGEIDTITNQLLTVEQQMTNHTHTSLNNLEIPSGNITFTKNSASNGIGQGIYFNTAAGDYARIVCGATGSEAGYLEIATADDNTEPIYVRQYKYVAPDKYFGTVQRTLTLLDASGNTTIPGTLTVGSTNVLTAINGKANTTHTHTSAQIMDIEALKIEILKSVNPVGSIYTSMTPTPPATLFGFGTWEQIVDRFLYCTNSASRNTGGSATHTHTTANHILTSGQLPKITGRLLDVVAGGNGAGEGVFSRTTYFNNTVNSAGANCRYGEFNMEFGNNEAHNHGATSASSTLPPYISCYAWVRTA